MLKKQAFFAFVKFVTASQQDKSKEDISKDNERNLCQDLLTIENTDLDLKVHELHYANELIVRVRLSFRSKTFANSPNKRKQ